MTARETLLFSIYKSLLDDAISIRYVIAKYLRIVECIVRTYLTGLNRNYITAPVNDSNLDYVPMFSGFNAGRAPARNTPASSRSLQSTEHQGRHTLSLNLTSRAEFPLRSIDADDLTPTPTQGMLDSGFLGLSRREVPKRFFLSPERG
jgi:hypothetical protein